MLSPVSVSLIFVPAVLRLHPSPASAAVSDAVSADSYSMVSRAPRLNSKQ